jgi:hypothetical protein
VADQNQRQPLTARLRGFEPSHDRFVEIRRKGVGVKGLSQKKKSGCFRVKFGLARRFVFGFGERVYG